MPCTHFMLNKDAPNIHFNLDITKKVYNWIKNKRSTLPFSNRWLYDIFGDKYKIGLSDLIKKNIVHAYPPLVDKSSNFVAQFEHTIYLHSFGKEVLSQDDDY